MEIKLTANHELFVITKLITFGKEIAIVMMPISEKQENALDNGSEIKLGSRWIAAEQIFCYGEMNFDNEDDIQLINNFEWIIEKKGLVIPANYDYDKHTCEAYDLKIGHHETFDNIKVVKYAHGCLNKPQRSIIFKIKVDELERLRDTE